MALIIMLSLSLVAGIGERVCEKKRPFLGKPTLLSAQNAHLRYQERMDKRVPVAAQVTSLHGSPETENKRDLGLGMSKVILTLALHRATDGIPVSHPPLLVFKSEPSQGLAKELLREDYLKIVVDKIDAANKSITLDFVQVERRNKKATPLRMVGIDLMK
ncbi:hypothetical protein PRIPAC_83269 [Pristionchus pacificus]|uniref:Uncharacterized protein n=1 Tax=Pristionchus pacificus TaxID=54126 RepID=A0A2A6BTN8_PRIPA|nr:hypothetical protein PRIPAC_83269 [Pristionchus pacificus]|eukprot:PDM69299.1 hypothetical protein PRIPAC_47601 [Pristionchus pacificus]